MNETQKKLRTMIDREFADLTERLRTFDKKKRGYKREYDNLVYDFICLCDKANTYAFLFALDEYYADLDEKLSSLDQDMAFLSMAMGKAA